MAQINWNNVAAPNLGESNSLFTQAIASLKDAGAGLKDTAKDYQTVVRNKSHAILQDYINSAKTPEELQSEAFNTGFKNLQATLANEYDAVKVNEYRDNAVDKLTRRASDTVALKRNTLGLTTDRQAVDTNDMMNRIFTAPESERPALIAEAVKLNRFDAKAMLTNQVNTGQLTQLTNANKLFTAQEPYLRVQPKLANEATEQSTAASKAGVLYQAGQLAVAQKNAETERQKAEAEAALNANGGKIPYAQQPTVIANKILHEGTVGIRKLEQSAALAELAKNKYATPQEVDDAFKAAQPWYKTSSTSSAMEAIKKILAANPDYVKADPKRQAAIYATTIGKMEASNVGGAHDYYVSDGNLKDYAKWADEAVKLNSRDITVANDLVKVRKQDLAYRLHLGTGMPLNAAKGAVDTYVTGTPSNPNADAKPAAQTPLQATNAGKIAGLQEKLNTKGLDLLQKASIEKQLKDLGATPQAATPVAKQVQKSVYVKSPLDIVSEAVTKRPTPLLPAEHQNAFKSKANNLSIDLGTGKTAPVKNPVAIPDVQWGKPVQAVTLDPILAKLPQHRAVITYAPDGDTAYGTSSNYTTAGQPQGKIRCRVDSINTPETPHKAGQPTQTYGAEAAKIFQDMVLNKEVSIRITKPTDGSSNYGRDVCQIEVAGKDVSVELLRAGAAWLYTNYNHYGTSGIALQDEAKAAGKGLWAYPNPINPETFSHNNR